MVTDKSLGRRIVLSHNESLHVYVLLDASGSVQQDNFELFRQSAVAIVDRVRGDSGVGPWGDHGGWGGEMGWDHGEKRWDYRGIMER